MTRPTPQELANEVHLRSVLIMLPFNEYLAQRDARLNYSHTPHSDLYSFRDAEGKQAYFRRIANSDAALPETQWGKDHDAAAFLRVDAGGRPLLNHGKPDVTVTFPGYNDKTAGLLSMLNSSDNDEALYERQGGTSYQEKFFSAFVRDQLEPALKKYQLTPGEVKTASHSMGDKYLYEYAMRYGTRDNLVIESSDRHDAAIAAASAKTLHHLPLTGNAPRDNQSYQAALKDNLQELLSRVTEVGGQGGAGAFDLSLGEKTVYSPESYTVRGAGHPVAGFLFKQEDDFAFYPSTGPRRASAEEIMKVANTDYRYPDESLKTAEILTYDRIYHQLAVDGFTASEQQTMERIRHTLGAPGMQVASMKQLQATYLAPPPKAQGRVPD